MSEGKMSDYLCQIATDLADIEGELGYLALAISTSNLTRADGAASLLFNIAARIGDAATLARGAMAKAEAAEEQQTP